MRRVVMRFLMLVGLVFSTPATSQEDKPKSLMQLMEQGCEVDRRAAVSAVDMRDSGKSKEDLAKILPPRGPNNNRIARMMWETLDDIYAYPKIMRFSYYAYRTHICFRQLLGKPVPLGFASVSDAVFACQDNFGDKISEDFTACISDAISNSVEK